MKRSFIKAIASMLVLSILISLPAFANVVKVEASESKKFTLEKLADEGEFDNFAYYEDGTILAYKGEEGSNKKDVYSYNYDKGEFEHLVSHEFDDWNWFYGTVVIGYGNLAIQKGKLSGILNKSGEVIIEPQYDDISLYHVDEEDDSVYYKVKKGKELGIIDEHNNEVIPFSENYEDHIRYIDDGIIIAKSED